MLQFVLSLDKMAPRRSFLLFREGVAGIILMLSASENGSFSSRGLCTEPSNEVGRVSKVRVVEREESDLWEQTEAGRGKSQLLLPKFMGVVVVWAGGVFGVLGSASKTRNFNLELAYGSELVCWMMGLAESSALSTEGIGSSEDMSNGLNGSVESKPALEGTGISEANKLVEKAWLVEEKLFMSRRGRLTR